MFCDILHEDGGLKCIANSSI